MSSDRSNLAERSSAVVVTPGGPIHGWIRPPGSKSLTNRALLCASLAEGTSRLTGALVSEDTEVMIESLRRIGVAIEVSDAGRTLTVGGLSGSERASLLNLSTPIELFIANSGTTIRFLTAALSAIGGSYVLSGVPRMHERPIGDLIDAISPIIGGKLSANSDGGCPPVSIESCGWSGTSVRVAGDVSSQYLSGLMMAAPTVGHPITIEVAGELVSRPYVAMTSALMSQFGAAVDDQGDLFRIEPGYRATDVAIEPDASAASYFWAAAAISRGTVTVKGLSKSALQGDVAFVDVLAQMGCTVEPHADSISVTGGDLVGIDVDMNPISDTVQTLAVVALFANGPTRVRGVAHNRFKETDRIGDLACELRRLGAAIDEHDDGLTIHPLPAFPKDPPLGVRLRTYHDHRMAMSLALAGLRIPGLEIDDPACTRKTYPEFWADLAQLTGRPHHWRGRVE